MTNYLCHPVCCQQQSAVPPHIVISRNVARRPLPFKYVQSSIFKKARDSQLQEHREKLAQLKERLGYKSSNWYNRTKYSQTKATGCSQLTYSAPRGHLLGLAILMSIYAWGANSHGQLGLGFESELCMSPQSVTNHSFAPNSVRCIRGGGGHVLVLDTMGRVHACGWNNRGQLGLDSTEECHNEFQCIPRQYFEDVPVESIACGWDISGGITSTKKLFVWGSNTFQQLGICQRGFSTVRRPLPILLPRNEGVQRISFGLRHCAALTVDQKVYIFGRIRIEDSISPHLTITSTSINRAPVIKVIPANGLRILSIISGQNHMLLKTFQGESGNSSKHIIGLGDNKFGQANSFSFDQDVKQVAAGWTHNAVLLKDNRIFVWGRNCYGQLGNGSKSDYSRVPLELKLDAKLVPGRLHLGSEHCLLRISSNGSVYTWGWNEHGNCGTENTENLYQPTLVKLPGPCRLAGAGAGFCFAICD